MPKEPGVKRDWVRRHDLIPSEILALKRGEDVMRENGEVIPFAGACHPVPKPRSYAFAADTRYWESVAEFVKGVDVLYHEATFGQAMKQRAEKTFSTAAQAGRIAANGSRSTDHRTHLSALPDFDGLLADACEFPRTILAEDGVQVDVSLVKNGDPA